MRSPLASHHGDHFILMPQRDRSEMSYLLCAGVFFVVASNKRSPFWRRKNNLVVLICTLLVSRLQQLRGLHLAVELLRAAHGLQAEISTLPPARRYAVTTDPRRHTAARKRDSAFTGTMRSRTVANFCTSAAACRLPAFD